VILDGRAIARQAAADPAADLRALLLAFSPEAAIPPMAEADDGAIPLAAEVNHGTWIAPCPCGAERLPAPGCVVWLAQPRAWCVRCGNAATAGRWRPILLPAPPERAAIEALLDRRPDAATRNWTPGETVDDLAAENRAHEIEHDI
jgi:hypothetical protein